MSCISEATLSALETIPCAHSENKLDHIFVLIKTLTVGHQKLQQKSGKTEEQTLARSNIFIKYLADAH